MFLDLDLKRAKKIRLPWWGVLCLIIASMLVSGVLQYYGKIDLALPMLLSMGMLGFAIAVKWKLRRRVWFWITMTVIGALHVLLISSVPWTTKWVPAVVTIPIATVDLYVILALVSIVEKFMVEPNTFGR